MRCCAPHLEVPSAQKSSYAIKNPFNTIPQNININDVEKILVNDLNNCTIKDRTEIQEEIHGVHCMAINETSELLSKSLKQLIIELNNNERIPLDEKHAYILSQQLQREHNEQQEYEQQQQQQQKMRHQQYGNQQNSSQQSSEQSSEQSSQQSSQQSQNLLYVNTNEFRLMYLRCELFDICKTAKWIVYALDFILEIYGQYGLERQIQISDFTRNELNIMKRGQQQLLPSRDRGDRQIMIIFIQNIFSDVPLLTLQKICFYLLLVCATSDIKNQKKGIVWIGWYKQLSRRGFKPRSKLLLSFSPVRIVSMHFCASDNTLIVNIAKALLISRLNSDLRINFLSNLGESIEIRYMLQSYGFPINTLPITWTGTIKTKNIKQFISIRSYIENQQSQNQNGSSVAGVTNNEASKITITDCPYLNDILFKKGNHAVHHSGNVKFRSIVHTVYGQHLKKQLLLEQQQQQQQQQQQHQPQQQQQQQQGTISKDLLLSTPTAPILPAAAVTIHIQMLVPDIIKSIQKENLRVLVWNTKKTWWDCISDHNYYEKHIYSSASNILKDSAAAIALHAHAAAAIIASSSQSHSIAEPQSFSTATNIVPTITTSRSRSTSTSTSTSTVLETAVTSTIKATATVTTATTSTSMLLNKRHQKQQVSHSSTSIFKSLDQNEDGKNKRKRYHCFENNGSGGGGDSSGDYSSDDNDDNNSNILLASSTTTTTTAECFGLSFFPCIYGDK